MADPDSNYRTKYLQALKEQELHEKQSKFQLELLRNALLRAGTALGGLDDQLDSAVDRLRETMRGGSGAQVVEQLERLQHSVGQFEQRRDEENFKAAQAMVALVEQYLALQIPGDLKKSLKDFNKEMAQRLSSYRQYPAALEDLAKLQQLALDAASQKDPGLWQRLRGGKTLKSIEQGQEKNSLRTSAALDTEDLAQNTPAIDLDRAMQTRFSDAEDSYEKVSERIAQTLENLVEKIKPNDLIKHKVDIVRHRLRRGLDWFALAVTLEDIRDILFLRYLQADEEFSEYLKRVKSELASIREALGGAQSGEAAHDKAVEAFSDSVSQGVGKIRRSLAGQGNIDSLKKEVSEHLVFIHDALNAFKESRREPSSLSEQLKILVERVHSVENESLKTKEMLEEQRHKAMHDSLTGLPNREAYNQRAFHEQQRFSRYGHPLTLAVCDIDFFKKINDGYGHQIGDKVLKLVAKLISTRLRQVDFVARYGGEEFVILMPETAAADAKTVLDKIRHTMSKTSFRFKDKPVQITLSFGIATFVGDDSVESVFERADKALYRAKDEGRNRCIVAG